jgi:hypothetical protein
MRVDPLARCRDVAERAKDNLRAMMVSGHGVNTITRMPQAAKASTMRSSIGGHTPQDVLRPLGIFRVDGRQHCRVGVLTTVKAAGGRADLSTKQDGGAPCAE